MQVEETALPGVLILTPRRYSDDRGFFSETWNRRTFAKVGIDVPFVQDNYSYSTERNTIRGLHYQAPPHAQAKLVRVIRGSIFDVAVDARIGSPTYGKWVGAAVSAEDGRQVYIPAGFLHGFVTREDNTEVLYKCSDHYMPSHEGSIAFDDPDLDIDWGVGREKARLSEKDANAPRMSEVKLPFEFELSI